MYKFTLSKLLCGISITSIIGLYCLAVAPSALAKNSSNSSGSQSSGSNSSGSQSSSSQSAITFNLDCIISGTAGSVSGLGGTTCIDAGTSFGTLTIKQNAADPNKVDIVVDLVGDNVHKVLDVNLNYNDSKFQNNSFQVSASSPYDVKSYEVSEDSLKAGPYSGLDFSISPKATGSSNDGYTATISLSNYDLNPEDFNFQDDLNKIFAAVHIGNYGNEPGESGGNSVWVGSTSYYKPPQTPVKVPEASTTVGLGLFTVATLRLLKKKLQVPV